MFIGGRFVMFSHRSDDTFDSTFAAKKYYLCRNLCIYNKFHYPKHQNCMKKYQTVILTIVFFVLSISQTYAWGLQGHRIVGELASGMLSCSANKKITRVLSNSSIAMAAIQYMALYQPRCQSDAKWVRFGGTLHRQRRVYIQGHLPYRLPQTTSRRRPNAKTTYPHRGRYVPTATSGTSRRLGR